MFQHLGFFISSQMYTKLKTELNQPGPPSDVLALDSGMRGNSHAGIPVDYYISDANLSFPYDGSTGYRGTVTIEKGGERWAVVGGGDFHQMNLRYLTGTLEELRTGERSSENMLQDVEIRALKYFSERIKNAGKLPQYNNRRKPTAEMVQLDMYREQLS